MCLISLQARISSLENLALPLRISLVAFHQEQLSKITAMLHLSAF